VRTRTWLTVAAAVTTSLLVLGGVAAAVSSGGYDPGQQGCSPSADANNRGTEPGCRNFQLNVGDGKGHRWAEAGIEQERQDQNPHAADVAVDSNGQTRGRHHGTGGQARVDTRWQPLAPGSCGVFDVATLPIEELLYLTGQRNSRPCSLKPQATTETPVVTDTQWKGSPDGSLLGTATNASLYLGADDNLDSGEHDGVDGKYGTSRSANGPSDGGAVVVNWHPLDVVKWVGVVAAVLSNPLDAARRGALLANPVPVADGGFGECADGQCVSAQSRQRAVYHGGNPKRSSRDAYDYSGKTWDPNGCSSGSAKDEQQCHGGRGQPQDMNGYRAAEARNVNAEPGLQVYEDPDPQGSPIGPYPLPAFYAGTCGVTLGGGTMPMPASPWTNKAGQLSMSTGC
jgi:hypothetical protein